MTRRAESIIAIAMAALVFGEAHAADQSYPTRPIRLIVPFPPRGAADAVARIVATPLGDRLGKVVIVDNRPGGGATIGAHLVAKQVLRLPS